MQGSRLKRHTQCHNNHIVSLSALKSSEMFQRNNRIWFMSGLALTIRVIRDKLKPLYGAYCSVHASPPLYWVSTFLTKRVLCSVFKLRHFSVSFQWKRIKGLSDTSLTATGKDLDVFLQINSELPAIYEWLCSNRLTLNLRKTKYLVFQPWQKISFNLYPPLKLADQYLEQSYSVKYLGLIIDCFLSWHEHIYHISSKVSKSVNVIAN